MMMFHLEREFRRRQRSCAHVFPVCPECLRTLGEPHSGDCPTLYESSFVSIDEIMEDPFIVGSRQCI